MSRGRAGQADSAPQKNHAKRSPPQPFQNPTSCLALSQFSGSQGGLGRGTPRLGRPATRKRAAATREGAFRSVSGSGSFAAGAAETFTTEPASAASALTR